MAERPETMAAINDAIGTADSITDKMLALREVAKLGDAPPLGDGPRQITLSQMCAQAAEQCGQLLEEITHIHRLMNKTNA